MLSSGGGHLQSMESDGATGGEVNLPRLEEPHLFAAGVAEGAFGGEAEAERWRWR